MKNTALLLASLLAFNMGCQATGGNNGTSGSKNSTELPVRVDTLYHYQIVSPDGLPLTLAELTNAISDTDVVLVGEWHTHPAIHLFQAQLLAMLADRSPAVALSMEQFTRVDQNTLNMYLAGEIGETALLRQTDAWPNYRSDYRPLIEIARQRGLSVLGANTTQQIVQCLSEKGIDILNVMPAQTRRAVARDLDASESEYKQKFFDRMGDALTPQQKENLYAAQIAWDETMAETITDHLVFQPSSQVMHIAGSFHVEGGLGIASRVKKRDASLSVAIIVPESYQDPVVADASSYRLIVNPLPKMIVEGEESLLSHSAGHGSFTDRCPYNL
ncbi:iron-regulated protein [Veronia nyctiphanis]|uniref:Iron-regulated protein n=1 Tax=Veronia nyctiphanis TaxID=1278244 RepID=A0A4Q0YRY9_9GAMM|nr:ChaN family lipoprotein [Veronia nyctiphanis]RXJ73896.1 iron-regulated protein [Veronia nyctiphanis]